MTAPERIWLQDGGDFDAASEVTWCQHSIDDADTEYVRADLAAVQPAQVLVKPWNYCPECGCEEPRYGEGPHKQCARCYQEWFTDIDYSGVVRGNLERLFIAALEPQPDPRDEVIARLVEALENRLHDPECPCNACEPMLAALAAAKAVQHG